MEHYKEAATAIGLSLCRDAIWFNDSCNWIGSSSEDYYGSPKAYAKALGTSFYDGTAGIAFFLLSLHQVLEEAIVERTAKGALQQLIRNELGTKNKNGLLHGKLGFHSGWTGCAYVLEKAGAFYKDKNYTDAARQLLKQCMELSQQYWGLDVIEGPAGAIPVLIRLSKKIKLPGLKEFILELGDYLMNKGERSTLGVSWNTVEEKVANLTGYAHGTAGFAHAFGELYAFTRDKKYQKLVEDVVRYEDAHFQPAQGNWPDFRSYEAYQSLEPAAQQPCSTAWCHGAPGIGLSRLRLYELMGDSRCKKDAEIAVETTRNAARLDMLGNYSLCHGLFGNAELLLYAADVFKKPEYKQQARQLADECINLFLKTRLPIPNGLQTMTETPDFMLGSSGIAYFFLRLYDPAKFENLLLIKADGHS